MRVEIKIRISLKKRYIQDPGALPDAGAVQDPANHVIVADQLCIPVGRSPVKKCDYILLVHREYDLFSW